MEADGTFASIFLLKVRKEMNEINNILVDYSTKHYFDVDKLPSYFVRFRVMDMKATAKSLQDRYHICLVQEFEILMAANDRAALSQHLAKIQSTIREIERYMFNYCKTFAHPLPPPCLLSCYIKGSNISLELLQHLYEILIDQQFKIALQDAKNAHPSHVPEPSRIDHALASSTFVDTVSPSDPPPTYNR